MDTLTQEQSEMLGEINDVALRGRYRRCLAMPQKLRDFFFSEEITDLLIAITKDKYSLPYVQRKTIASYVGLVIIGEMEIQTFIPSLINGAHLNQETARAIAADINEKIFQPVRDELLEVHGISSENGEIKMNGNGVSQASRTVEEAHSAPPPTTIPEKVGEMPEAIEQKTEVEASSKRAELLERLRQASGDTDVIQAAPPPETLPTENTASAAPYSPQSTPPKPPLKEIKDKIGPEKPKATMAAWNGKRIDLSKIPPRREVQKNGNKEVSENDVVLKKGRDGYWYEV